MKKMILVTSPPASGKTFVSMALAQELKHVVYLDKDTLIPLSRQIFAVAGQEYNRSSDFFQKNIRDYEYEVIVNLGLDALCYDDIVLINAPFTREIRSEDYMQALEEKCRAQGASLFVIWVIAPLDIIHQRMQQRNSERDVWKLAHWEEYAKTLDLDIPQALSGPGANHNLLLFYNSSQLEFEESLTRVVTRLETRAHATDSRP